MLISLTVGLLTGLVIGLVTGAVGLYSLQRKGLAKYNQDLQDKNSLLEQMNSKFRSDLEKNLKVSEVKYTPVEKDKNE